jgi:hypothetical protein
MATRITESHDKMILSRLSGTGLSAANRDTFLQNVKTFLDANYAMFKDGSGNYTVPHVNAAFTQVWNRGK